MDTSANVIKKVAKLSIKLPASSIQHHQVNVLMFGPSRHGKSSTGNSMLGKKEFPVSCDGESETTEFMSKFTDFEQYRVKIVDSPPAPRVNPQHNNNILKYCGSFIPQIAKRFPKGCHAPVLVLRFGNRFESHDEFSVTMLKEMFGEKFIFEHCVCVVTHGDMFNKVMAEGQTGRSLYDWCRDQKGVLEKIFKAVNYRCVLFDNFGDLDTKKEQMHQLMHLIVDSWPQAMDIVSVSPQMRILADIHTLLESAPSFDDYQKQLQFLVSYTGSYNIGSRQVQISVMIFGTSQHLRFDFTEFSSHDEFARKILSAPYLGASSGTDTALALARQESFGPDSGSRPGVKQMALMITEGRSKDESKTAEEAAQLKDSGTQIMVIGVASVDRKTVECLASDPEDVFIAEDYEELEQEIPKIAKQRTCVVAPEFKSTADILFILDSSGSISPEDFQKELAFVVNLTEAFNIGIGAVRFSAMVFSNSPQIVYDFKFTNHEEIKRATYRSPHFRGSTNTADALDLARTMAFTAEGGTRDNKKIAIVITDGASNDLKKTARAAEKLTDSGVSTLAIGVGNIKMKELQLIASLDGDVYIVDNYDVIQTIQDEIEGRISKLALEFESTAKVLFILDSSGSMGDTDYKKELDFVVKITECFDIGSGDVRFSVMIFSTSPQLLFDFSRNTHKEVKEAILNAPYLNGRTNTAAALDLARTSAFNIQDGTCNRKIAIVITDGKSRNSDATSDAAGKLKETGVLIIAIGVGNANKRELERIVSKPGDVYMVEDCDALFRIQDEITQQLTFNHKNRRRPRGNSPERLQRRAPEPQADVVDLRVDLGGLMDFLKFW